MLSAVMLNAFPMRPHISNSLSKYCHFLPTVLCKFQNCVHVLFAKIIFLFQECIFITFNELFLRIFVLSIRKLVASANTQVM